MLLSHSALLYFGCKKGSVKHLRDGSRAAATSKMERFVIIVNGFRHCISSGLSSTFLRFTLKLVKIDILIYWKIKQICRSCGRILCILFISREKFEIKFRNGYCFYCFWHHWLKNVTNLANHLHSPVLIKTIESFALLMIWINIRIEVTKFSFLFLVIKVIHNIYCITVI